MGRPASAGPSRREFLAALAAFSAVPAARRAPTRLIDVHHHVFPPAYLSAVAEGFSPAIKVLVSAWTPARAMAEMDEAGVAMGIASLSPPGPWRGEVEAARSLSRKCNEYCAQLVRDHPGRFGFFASLPLPDTEGSLREIAYALDVLKADGVGLMTSYGDKWPGHASFAPVFDELNRRRAVVYFHPTAAECCRSLVPGLPVSWAEYPHDTTRAVLSLLVSGALARLREMRLVFSHAGGTIPMLAGRIIQLGHHAGDLAQAAPQGVDHELKRLYYDTAVSANRPAMAALMAYVPTAQILFGSDAPFVPIAATADGLGTLGLSASDLEAIGHGNASALFPARIKASLSA